MGNRPTKISRGAPSRGNQRSENDRDLVSPSASKRSSSKEQAIAQVHCTEVFIVRVTPKENEVYILVPSEETEGERPQDNFENSGDLPSIATTSGSSEVASGILEEANGAPELVDSTTEILVKTDVLSIGLDSLCEACQLLLPEGSPTPPPKTYRASSSGEHASDCLTDSEEEIAAGPALVDTLSVGMAEPWKGTNDLHPSADLLKGTEVPGSDQKVSCEMDLELTTDDGQGTVERQATGQREPDEAASKECLQRTAEPHPDLILAETRDVPSIIMANEQLAEGQAGSQNHHSFSASEIEGEISEERSFIGSWKGRENPCSPDEVSVESELQPDDQKVPCRMSLEEDPQGATQEPTAGQRQLYDEASPEKAEDVESPLDSALVETSGGTSSVGTAPGTKQLAEERSLPGQDLPLAGIEMEGEVPGDGSGAENLGEITEAVSTRLKMPPPEAQDKMLAQVEDETACPVASNTTLEKELERTQSLSTVEERPNCDAQLLVRDEFLDSAQRDKASLTSEALLPEAQTFAQAQLPAEVTVMQSSPKARLGTAGTMKEPEEASRGQPLAEGTTEQAGSPEARLSPEVAPVSGTPLWVADGEEDAEFVDATDTCEATEVPASARVLEGQEERDGKGELMQESPIGSPDHREG